MIRKTPSAFALDTELDNGKRFFCRDISVASLPWEALLVIRKKHDQRRELPISIVTTRCAKIFAEALFAHPPKDNVVTTRKNVRILDVRLDVATALQQARAFIQQSVSLLSRQSEYENFGSAERLGEADRIAEATLP